MSAPLSIDAYDAQMLDFSDSDVTMNITGSAEFFAEAVMDHDGHLSTYGEHPSVEVDMDEYAGDNAEYEMADETAEYPRLHGDELLDVEVYDASHVPSPLVPPQPLQPSTDILIASEHSAATSPVSTEPAALPEVQGELEVHPTPLDQAADARHVESSALVEGVSSEGLSSELAHPTNVTNESTLPVSESREQLGDTVHPIGRSSETPAPAEAVSEATFHVPPVAEEQHLVGSEVAQRKSSESPAVESAPLENAREAYDGGSVAQDEQATDQATTTEGEAVDPLHISDGVYIDPPPAVLLSITDVSHPSFVLFNQPEVEDQSTGGPHSNAEALSLLLENRPTLYYEPLSSVFEALRQDEALLSRVPHSFEGELILDAYDLQLTASEDNVHSREISLHDLNVIHDGSDFAGPLRLLLRASVPRFIMRYYALQEQIQRLHAAAETGEAEHDQGHQEEYETGEQRLPQPEEAATSTHVVVSDGSEALTATEAEEPAKESVYPPEPNEETPRESRAQEDTSGVQELAAEYHEVAGEVVHALENEDDYEGTNTGDEDESANSESLDADQVHATTAEEADAAATVTGHEPEFGGEQTEYLDYVQSEEFDERYGEDLPERTGGPSPAQYGEPPHYEEEQNTSTAVDETQALLPASEEDEDNSNATPVPTRTVLEPEVNGSADESFANELVLRRADVPIPGRTEHSTSECTNEVTPTEQISGNEEPDTVNAKTSSEVDESDSNFASILEREAGADLAYLPFLAPAHESNIDAEFDRTFNAEQNEQEGSITAALQQEPNWDEWDDEDAEGEDEEDWIDPEAASNESSITLSSKASSKRSYDEVDPNEEVYVEDPHSSPGSKRPRVQ